MTDVKIKTNCKQGRVKFGNIDPLNSFEYASVMCA